MDEVEFLGYVPERENRDAIQSSAVPFTVTYADFEAPEEVDPRKSVRHDKQGNMGSCQGFSLTNSGERLRVIARGGSDYSEEDQFSQLFAYLETQRLDGLLGRDAGSTIEKGLTVAKQIGFLESKALPYRTPYPSNATTLVTSEMRKAASAFRVKSHSWLTSYDEIFRYLASGAGVVHTGTVWNNSFYAPNGVLESISLSNGGGHATAWLGYSKRKDTKGRNYIWRLNSHNDSWVEMAPTVIDQICKHQWSSIVGMSDLNVPGPRKIDWKKAQVI